jgi:diguanylate cyclase (GGDEF)-like protein/PAS domain S-box-containing protein
MKNNKFVHLLPSFIFLCGIFITLFIGLLSKKWLEENESLRFKTASEQIITLVKQRLQENIQLIQSAVSFMEASENVTRDEWQTFILTQGLIDKFQGIQGVGYAQFVTEENKNILIEQMKNEGFKNFNIFPDQQTKDAFVSIFIEPFTTENMRILGFNMASESIRRNTIEKAFSTKEPALSSKIELVQEKDFDEKAGFAIFAPLFDENSQPKGVIFAGIKVKKLFENVLGARYIKIDFEIYDTQDMNKKTKLYDSNPKLQNTRLNGYKKVSFYGHEWTFYFKSNIGLDIGNINKTIPLLSVFIGFLITLFFSLWVRSLLNTRQEAYKIIKEKTKQIEHSEMQIRSIFQAMQEGIIVQNADGEIIECNLAAQEILKVNMEDIIGKTSDDPKWQAIYEDGAHFPPEKRPAKMVFQTKQAQENVIMGIIREDGTKVWVMVNAQPIFDDTFTNVNSVVITFNDITDFRASKKELERYVALVDANVIISSTDLEGTITEVSEAFCRISGYTKEELIGKNHNIVRHEEMPDSLYKELWEVISEDKSWHGEMKNRRKDGSDYWVDAVISPRYNEDGDKIGYIAIRQDITNQKHIEELSITDRLTGIYNRLKLDEFFEHQLNFVKRHNEPFSIIITDIDKFKAVNDNFGHQVGDEVLKEFAALIKANLREEDVFGRWGGEEFLILLPATSLGGAKALAEKLRNLIEQNNFSHVGHKTSSFGVASYQSFDDAKTMVARADAALYKAKSNGRNLVMTQED